MLEMWRKTVRLLRNDDGVLDDNISRWGWAMFAFGVLAFAVPLLLSAVQGDLSTMITNFTNLF